MASKHDIVKILILTVNPKHLEFLRLGEEVRRIGDALKSAKNRDQFELKQERAVRPIDMRRAMLEYEPHIVHFSGHGVGEGGLALEDNERQVKLVSTDALAEMFGLAKQVECVLLNACYSEFQAEAIVQHIPYVIGMSQAIGDEAALEFAVGFYDALGAGYKYERAFREGRLSIRMEGIAGHLTPVIMKKPLTLPTPTDSKEPEEKPVTPTVLEEPEGSVPLGSRFYVERPPIEADCYERIVRMWALIRIKAPGHMGKTSLMRRVIYHAKQQGYQTVYVNFRAVDSEFWASSDQFLQWFCGSVTEAMNLPDRLTDYWQGVLGDGNKSTKYFEKYLLAECESSLVLGLDNVDEIFPHENIAKGFFGLLRTWHEQSKNDDVWQKLRLVIVHSKEVPLAIKHSPFNVGFAAELRELGQAEVQDIVQRHRIHWTETQVGQLMQLVGGHPYLLRVALYQIARKHLTLTELLRVAPTEGGLYGEHLLRHYLNLKSDVKLLTALHQVVSSNRPVKVAPEEAARLRSMGLVKYQGNSVIPLCDLYRRYFYDRVTN